MTTEPLDQACQDCGAEPGMHCHWACSSNNPEVIDLDHLAHLIQIIADREHTPIRATVEQTGGGCATLTVYDGSARYWGQTDSKREQFYGWRALALAGPGWFDGPGWTDGRASTDEFSIGMDEDTGDQAFYITTGEYRKMGLEGLAAVIHAVARTTQERIERGWDGVADDERPHWWNVDENPVT